MSSPKRDAVPGGAGRPVAMALAWPAAPLAGRLMPLALDEARWRQDDTLGSVLLGGMSRRQVDAVRFRAPGAAGRLWRRLTAAPRRLFRIPG